MHSLSVVYRNSAAFIPRQEGSAQAYTTGDCVLCATFLKSFLYFPPVSKTGLDELWVGYSRTCVASSGFPLTPKSPTPTHLPYPYMRS